MAVYNIEGKYDRLFLDDFLLLSVNSALLAKWLVPAQLFDYCLLKHAISAW